MSVESEKDLTELTIGADGRVFVHGTSRKVLEVLEALDPRDVRVRIMLEHVREMEKLNQAKEVESRIV